MESLYSDQLEDHLSELAHHYSCSANARKAVHFLGRARRQAEERSAYSQALVFLNKALELLKELPDDAESAREEFDLQMASEILFSHTKGLASAERETAVVRARELAERLGDEGRRTKALIALSNCMLNCGTPAAREVAEQALALAERANNARVLALAQLQLGLVLFLSGEFPGSRDHCERAFEFFGPGPYRNLVPESARWTETCLVLIPVLLGYPDIARKRSDDMLAAARPSSDPGYIAQALLTDAWANSLLRDAPKVQKRTEELVAIGAEYGRVVDLTMGTLWQGWALAVQGRPDEGISKIQRAVRRVRDEAGNQGFFRSILAEAYLASGRPDEGLEAVSYGLTSGEKSGHRHYEARLHHLKGELLLMQNSTNMQAEGCYRTAIAIARRQSAKLFELSATTSLARLLARQYRRDESRAMLAEIYNWFTEGFDTADLKEAKALLDELGN
jgi:tetratricopeptide (TPR) repeat protein